MEDHYYIAAPHPMTGELVWLSKIFKDDRMVAMICNVSRKEFRELYRLYKKKTKKGYGVILKHVWKDLEEKYGSVNTDPLSSDSAALRTSSFA